MTQEQADTVTRILDGARWSMSIRLIGQVLSWVSTIVVVRFLSVGDYGLNAMLETPLEFLFLFSTFGLDAALVRAKTLEKDEIRSAFGWLLLLNVVLFCVYFFGSHLIAGYFAEPRLAQLAQVLSIIFLAAPFRVVPNALLDRQLKFKKRATIELVSNVVAAAVSLLLAVLGFGVWALVAGVVLNRMLSILILMVVEPWFVLPSFKLAPALRLISYGGVMAGASAVAITAGMLPVAIAGPKLGATEMGLFAVALQFALLPLSKIMPVINPLVAPAFARFQGQPEAILGYLQRLLGLTCLIILPVAVGLAVLSQEFVLAVIGPQWRSAILPLSLLALLMPLRAFTSIIRQVLGSVGFASLALASTAVQWLSTLVLVLVLLPHGLLGLVLAVLLSEPITLVATVWLARQAIGARWSGLWRAVLPAVVAAALMLLALAALKHWLVGGPPMLTLLLGIFAGAAAYLASLWRFFRQDLQRAFQVITGRSRAA